MKTLHRDRQTFRHSLVYGALTLAFSSVQAAELDEVGVLVTPESHISAGIGYLNADSRRFGAYNGLRDKGDIGLVDFSLVKRDEEGFWLWANGQRVGLPDQQFGFGAERQGDWRVSIEYDQTPRYTPYDLHTNLRGIGSNSQSYPATYTANQTRSTAGGIQLHTERETSRLGLSKILGPYELKVLFQNQEKDGNRPFGRGTPSFQEFLAEPIHSTTRQLDVSLDYTGDRLQLSGGYYGSWFYNRNAGSSLAVSSGASALSTFNLISLPPDNQAHRLQLSGAYRFTDKTRGTFKLAYGRITQDESYMDVGPTYRNESGRSSLGGRLNTTLAQLGLSSRPMAGLTLTGSYRYEERDDKTPVSQYIYGGTVAVPTALPGSSTTDGRNEHRSLKNHTLKLEAGYLLPRGYRLNAGFEQDIKERNADGVRVVGYRAEIDEQSYRLELRRAMAETLSGSVALVHGKRTGDAYRRLVKLDGVTDYGSNLLQPIYIGNRDRDKLKLSLDWTPLEALSLQLVAEKSKDDYGPGRSTPDIGMRKGEASLVSLDGAYALTDAWNLTAWVTRNDTRMNQADCSKRTAAGASATCDLSVWSAAVSNRSDSWGLGFRGKIRKTLEVGGDLSLAHDLSRYQLTGAGAANLPDISSQMHTLKLFAKYALNPSTSIKADYLVDKRRTNDWTWTNWTYSDGTWFDVRPSETVRFIAFTINYTFQ